MSELNPHDRAIFEAGKAAERAERERRLLALTSFSNADAAEMLAAANRECDELRDELAAAKAENERRRADAEATRQWCALKGALHAEGSDVREALNEVLRRLQPTTPPASPEPCGYCRGKGFTYATVHQLPGERNRCDDCNGAGFIR